MILLILGAAAFGMGCLIGQILIFALDGPKAKSRVDPQFDALCRTAMRPPPLILPGWEVTGYEWDDDCGARAVYGPPDREAAATTNSGIILTPVSGFQIAWNEASCEDTGDATF